LSKERIRERFNGRFFASRSKWLWPNAIRTDLSAARDARGDLSLDKERFKK